MARPSTGTMLSTTDEAFLALLNAARRDQAVEIERALERLTGLPGYAVHWICETGWPEPLAVVGKALGFKRKLFGALYARLHGAKPYGDYAKSTAFRSAVIQFDRIQHRHAASLLAQWRMVPATTWHEPLPGAAAKPGRRAKAVPKRRSRARPISAPDTADRRHVH